MPSWLGAPEFIVIALVLLVLFGWKKLPDAARSLGRSMRIFKAEVDELKREPSAASTDTVQGTISNAAPAAGQDQSGSQAQPQAEQPAATQAPGESRAAGNADSRS